MKVKNILLPLLIVVIASTIFSCSNSRQANNAQVADSTSVSEMINSHTFVFIPRYVNPMTGRRRELTSGFELSMSKDSLVSYLPFLGRGYTAPISPADVDFDFTSTNFTYVVTQARKGWNISIKPKDQIQLQELYFRIYDDASASLNITSINRSSISYDGYITLRKTYKDKKK